METTCRRLRGETAIYRALLTAQRWAPVRTCTKLAGLKRKLVAEVLASIKQTVAAHETFAEANVVSNRERDAWSIPAGNAVRTPPSWGHPSSRYIGGEAARRRAPTSSIDFR